MAGSKPPQQPREAILRQAGPTRVWPQAVREGGAKTARTSSSRRWSPCLFRSTHLGATQRLPQGALHSASPSLGGTSGGGQVISGESKFRVGDAHQLLTEAVRGNGGRRRAEHGTLRDATGEMNRCGERILYTRLLAVQQGKELRHPPAQARHHLVRAECVKDAAVINRAEGPSVAHQHRTDLPRLPR
ncbi:uncharacterized protein Tco025E_05113 [Trypanosoma conorhini]|uniref:Uncharacterized protein n=1 Tax=Trypanosoma conorhini TaxID=83891 RepID=A0A3R7KZM4_9TRYP|nr:uncharacterized protein Tco025E_05113 [Trypanosoma conorhini]RNF16634.1 hypothetical protein Tco025E_05113 [Trypanosoma conorhini]